MMNEKEIAFKTKLAGKIFESIMQKMPDGSEDTVRLCSKRTTMAVNAIYEGLTKGIPSYCLGCNDI